MAQSTATTTLTVLDTPPNWTVIAQTSPPSNSSTPTNVSSSVTWIGTGTSPNNNSYYLLLCKNSSTPIAGSGGGAPSCTSSSTNQWSVSPLTTSGSQASTSYVASSTDPQLNPWFAWICDNNTGSGGAKCNGTYEQGSGTSSSPFVVNHRPNFSNFTNNSPKAPGTSVTWTANASDTDNFTAATDTVQLFVCKASDFTGSACGAGGTYCTSTLAVSSPSCSYTIPIPKQDQGYSSFGYVLDNHLLVALGGSEGTNSTATVSNVAPTISSSSISLLNTDGSSTNLALTNPAGQTTGFETKFTVSSNNSCLAPGGGQEITSAALNVYRSGIGSGSCSSTSNYNANNCYPYTLPSSSWNYSCSQDGGSCSGSSSLTATWTCTFPLWYNTDPTDGSSNTSTQYFNQTWLTNVQATNWVGATSSFTQASLGSVVTSFLAAQLNTATINFGQLNTGSNNATLATSTVMAATGNVGLDQNLYGADMCPTYTGSSPCLVSTTSTIPVGQIQYATTSVAYGSGSALSTSSTPFLIHIAKSTATSSQSTGSTFWGIGVPASIQLSGAYTGQNTFIGVKSNALFW